MEAPIYLKGRARKGPTYREAILMHAVARLALHPHFTNIQTSWVKMGPDGSKAALSAGANDMGGTLMNESITRSAGATWGQELAPAEMERLIAGIGREPRQRTTLYGAVPAEREAASRAAIALDPIVNNAPQTTKSKQTNFKPSPPARDAVRASQGD
jgi:FO synthase